MGEQRETIVERTERRRMRRWKRRLQALAPLLALPAVFGLLALSVNLIEFRSTPKPRIRTAPIRTTSASASPDTHRESTGLAIETDRRTGERPTGVLDLSVVSGDLAVDIQLDAATR